MHATHVNDASAELGGELAGVLRGPDAVIAAIPYLLGFHPQDSIVIVWMRERRICLTQRMDLASDGIGEGLAVNAVAMIAANAQATSAIAVIYGGDPNAHRGWRRDVYEALARGLDSAQVPLVDALHVHQGRWWSYQCKQECCPASGRAIDLLVQQEVASILADACSEPAQSREAVVGVLAPDPNAQARIGPRVEGLAAALRALIDEAEHAPQALEQWRDQHLARLLPRFLGHGINPRSTDEGEVAAVIVGLSDVRVRDTLLWHLAQARDVDACLGWLANAMRAAPDGHVAPVATCTAIAAWLHGDGVRANAALERALADDRDYALGWLVAQSIINGLPPDTWRGVMSTLSERECRTGNPAPMDDEPDDEPDESRFDRRQGGGDLADPLAQDGG